MKLIQKILQKSVNFIEWLFKFDYYEASFGAIFFIQLGLAFYLTKLLLIVDNPVFQMTKFTLLDLYPIGIIMVIASVYKGLVITGLTPLIAEKYLDHQRYNTKQLQLSRANTISKYTVDFFMYVFSTIFGFYTLKDCDFMDPIFMGTGHHSNIFKDIELNNVPANLQYYLWFCIAVHSESFFQHLLTNMYEKKYYEFLLHHGMAFFLLVFSYLYNCWKIGALVVFLHDSSDVLLTLVRVLADYKHINKNLINGIFVFNVLFWIYSRIIYFPMYVIYEPIVVSSSGRIDKYGYSFTFGFNWLISQLCILCVMHIYWVFFMIKSAIYYNKGDKKTLKRYDVNQIDKQEENIQFNKKKR